MSYPYTNIPTTYSSTYHYPSYNPITGQTVPTVPVVSSVPGSYPTIINPVYNTPTTGYPTYQYRPYSY